MATPQERLANALEALEALQGDGRHAIRSRDLSRDARELLTRNGFLREVMRGWYIPGQPGQPDGETTAWYAAYWGFAVDYLTERFGENWSLSADLSLILQAGEWNVPAQLLVRARGGRNGVTTFLHGTSLLDVNQPPASNGDVVVVQGLRLYTVEAALIGASPGFFRNHPIEARTILAMQRDASTLLERLLAGGHTIIASRLAGAFRNVGRGREADAILQAMTAAGYKAREIDPFAAQLPAAPYRREPSPYVHRIRLLWAKMREDIPSRFPAPGRINDLDRYMKAVDEVYVTDAYHSLSIEGYRVSRELIERVRGGGWNPEGDEADRALFDAMAARGYWQAFNAVKDSVRAVLSGENPGAVADRDQPTWYRELFAPRVGAGLISAAKLAGYRNTPVYIRNSRHVPLSADAVRDAMPTFFELLAEEPDPAVRVVLGHFMFVYIHPYLDGNGRTGRFLMNVMMAAGGYPWTVIPVQARDRYMAALETASVEQNIGPFADFLADHAGRRAPAAA
jgi:Fic/DOC family